MWYELGSDINPAGNSSFLYATEHIGEPEAIKKEYWQFKLDSFLMSIFLIALTRSKQIL